MRRGTTFETTEIKPVAAERENRERELVVAGEDGEARPACRGMQSVICARLPDASFTLTMRGCHRQLERRRRLDVAARAARHVVDDDRQVDGVGDGA